MSNSVAFRTPDISLPDGIADCYLAHPADGAQHPGVLLFPDAYGLRPVIREIMETIAADGFTVLAPNVLYRSGRSPVLPMPDRRDPAGHAEFFKKLGPVRAALTPAKSLQDAAVYLNYLAASEFCAPGAIGVVGYCMGGRMALRVAAAYTTRIAAAASFHGGRLAEVDAPDSPHHSIGDATAELFIAHASADQSMTPADIEVLERSLKSAAVPHTSVVYPDTAHGFTMRDTPVFDEQAYQRHLNDLLALLRRNVPEHPRR
ncbi:dienelactone hydrolase family protein [Nocardia goodfellowii]|uniref:Carboxymethylenebutenolidase n=1 Tax=Nocardia goodfellowii TaxID=882446 RepID=A0ABS4QD95_9NOCA|nr:dienelactone hydrolase family protein [Nocardia goodfellowii]MBP2189627.1 carboxymethylenebutenolidase [Nocardia goodfellowii]